MNSAWQMEPQPFQDPSMKLSWNERRKMARYQKQVEKDERRRGKEEERERRREEKVWEKQWREYYKAQEKETKKWRKASSHHPELNNLLPASSPSAHASSSSPHEATMFPFDLQQHHQPHHAFHLHSPHVSHAHPTTTPTRPLPHMLVPSERERGGVYTPQYVPLLLPLAGFGVLQGGGGQERPLPVVSRCVITKINRITDPRIPC